MAIMIGIVDRFVRHMLSVLPFRKIYSTYSPFFVFFAAVNLVVLVPQMTISNFANAGFPTRRTSERFTHLRVSSRRVKFSESRTACGKFVNKQQVACRYFGHKRKLERHENQS
jgi:hypothetical protein